MPADDIRIWQGFLTSRKTRRLKIELGPGAVEYIISLWLDAAIHCPRGILTGYDATDIACAAGFDGDPQLFVETLCKAGFLDHCDNGDFGLHNWEKRQPWVFGAPDRSEWAREMNRKRWGNKKKQKRKVNPKRKPLRNPKRNPPILSTTTRGKDRTRAREPDFDGGSRSRASVSGRRITGPESLGSVLKKSGIGGKKIDQ